MDQPCQSYVLSSQVFSNQLSCTHACQVTLIVSDSVTPWTVTHQAPLSMGFSRQEDWSGLLCPPPGDPSDPGIKPRSPASPALACGFFTTSTTWEALINDPPPHPLPVAVKSLLSSVLTLLILHFWDVCGPARNWDRMVFPHNVIKEKSTNSTTMLSIM